jgi:hypothetical protein
MERGILTKTTDEALRREVAVDHLREDELQHDKDVPSSSRTRSRRSWLWLILVVCLGGTLAAAAGTPSEHYTIELGPFSLPAGSGHHEGEQPGLMKLAPPVDGWLRGLSIELVDGKGEQLPAQMLHHLNLIAPNRRELFSPIMLRIGAAGPETRPYTLPWFLGYRLRPGDSLLVSAMVHNPTSKGYDGVRLRVRLELSPATSWLKPLAVQPVYLDVMPPAGIHAYDLPPGRSIKSWEGRPAVPARLLAAGGHLHQYGTALRLENVSTGKVLWEARPKLGPDREVLGMPVRYFPLRGIRLEPDQLYRLTAEYDNPTGKVLAGGGMGALGGIVVPGSGTLWPNVARGDSVYQHDVRTITGEGSTHHSSEHAGGQHH